MKIAIFTDCYLDLTGGIVTTINLDKAELERRGHTVTIFSSAYPKSKQAQKSLAKSHIFPVPSCKIFGRGLTPIARRPKVIERWLASHHPELKNYDVFYVHYEAGASIAGLRFAKKHHIPTVQVMHGREDVAEASLIPRGLRTFVATMLNWFHSWYLPHPVRVRRDAYLARTVAARKMWTLMVNHANAADVVLTPSEHFAKKLRHYGVTKEIIALSHGVPDELCAAPRPVRSYDRAAPLKIIWHSRLSGEKRIIPFLEAVAGYAHPYRLDLYGVGVEARRARRFASRHHLSATFHGETDVRQVLAAAKKSHLDVLVSYNYDTFGMTLIEAAASGTPILLADPDLAEILPPGGYLLAQNPSPAAMTAALDSLFSDPAQISRMSETLLNYRHHYKLSTKIDKLVAIFTKITKSVV